MTIIGFPQGPFPRDSQQTDDYLPCDTEPKPFPGICPKCQIPQVECSCPQWHGEYPPEEMVEMPNSPAPLPHYVTAEDLINSPAHYKWHPSGVECIQITEHMNFCLGNAVKYIWRADLKGSDTADLEKAIWYLKRELKRRANAPLR